MQHSIVKWTQEIGPDGGFATSNNNKHASWGQRISSKCAAHKHMLSYLVSKNPGKSTLLLPTKCRQIPWRGCVPSRDLTERSRRGLPAWLRSIQKESGFLGVAVGERGAANPAVPCGWGCGKLVATGHHKAEHEKECAHREVGRGLHTPSPSQQ